MNAIWSQWFCHLISSVLPFHTHTNIYILIYREKFFWNICEKKNCTFTPWNSSTPNLVMNLSSKDQAKENLGKHLQHSYLHWLLPNILRDLLTSVASCSWSTSALSHYFPLPIQIFPIPTAPDEHPLKTYPPINFTSYHKLTKRTSDEFPSLTLFSRLRSNTYLLMQFFLFCVRWYAECSKKLKIFLYILHMYEDI